MAIEDVGVRFVAEGAPQFEATLKRANKAVENFGDSANKASKSVETSWSKLEKTMNSPEFTRFALGAATAVASALVGIGAAVKKLADDYMGYAFQVKDFGRIIGATPQEASKLIQVADDVRLSVGSMTVAMRTAITKGYTPTVEGLGRMSDAYLQIQDPLQRSKFLIETFGRSGLEMAKLMELGSDKIKAMGDSIEGTGRLMTTEGIQKAQAYFDALDKLQDSIAGVTLTLGGKFTPAITETANGLTQIVDDGVGVIDMFIAFQEAAQAGAINAYGLKVNLYDLQNALVDYAVTNKTAVQVTDDFRKMTQTARDATWTFTDSLLRNKPAASAASEQVGLLTTNLRSVGDVAGQSANELANLASEAAGIKSVEIGLEFKAPDIASQMSNLIKSIDWKAAGGEALTTFMTGFAGQVAPLTDEQKKKIAAQVGSVAIALDVKTGDITKWEGITKIKELSGMNTTDAQNLIKTIGEMTPPDISTFLNNIITLGSGEGAAAATTQTDNLATSISGVANAMTINQATFSGWTTTTSELGEKTDVAQKMTEFLRVKMENTGKSAALNMDKLTGWKDTVDEIGTKSHEAASFAVDLNQQLKNIPAKITVDIYIQTHGTIPTVGGTSKIDEDNPVPNPGKHASGGPTYANTLYLVGERGPELFIPTSSGYMIPNNKTMDILNNIFTIIPMAAGGKMTSKYEKEHNKKIKLQRKPPKQTGNTNGDEGTDSTGNDEDISSAYNYAVSLLQYSVAEYNYLLRHGASKTVLAEKKASIDLLNRQVGDLARLKQIQEYKKIQEDLGIPGSGKPAAGMPGSGSDTTISWLDEIIAKFKKLFGLLNSSEANQAMSALSPLVSNSPAPLATGLSQIKRQMDKLSMTALPNFYGSVAQLAGQNYYQNSSATYNINVPVTATVNNGTDISRIAYAVAKEIAANVRS